MPPRSRPLAVEPLEDRAVPATRFVVPFDLPADGQSTFYTLRAALTAPGLAAGDAVQIEPRSVPGTFSGGDVPAVRNLTVRGNPDVGAAETPAAFLLNTLAVDAARTGFALRDVHLVLLGGPLQFRAPGSLSTSLLTGQSAAGAAVVEVLDTSGVQVDRNSITANAATPSVVRVEAAAGTANRLQFNQLVANARTGSQSALRYAETTAAGVSAVGDVVEGNTFVALDGDDAEPLVDVGRGVSGLTVRGNTFRDLDSQTRVGLRVGGTSGAAGTQTVTVSDNAFRGVAGGQRNALELRGHADILAAVVERNLFDARPAASPFSRPAWGAGLAVVVNGGPVRVKVEGNDFQLTRIGVALTGSGSATAIDLGGGTLGGRGGNDFRGFTLAATPDSGAVVNFIPSGTDTTAVVRFNSFSVLDPEVVVFDADDTGGSTSNTIANSPYAANQAYVQSLYVRLLRRLGDVFNPNDAGFWVGRLGAAGPTPQQQAEAASFVVTNIYRSTEGIGVQVSDLFERYLERQAEPQARADFARLVQGGMTYEQVTAVLCDSGEYRTRVGGSDPRFVQTLFVKAMGRPANAAETQAWVGALRGVGGNRFALTLQFVGQREVRTHTVREFYLRVLRRQTPPTGAEIDGWANLNASLYDIYVGFLASGEYRANG